MFTLSPRSRPSAPTQRTRRRTPARSLVCLAAAMAALAVPAIIVVAPAQALDPRGVGPRNPQTGGFPTFYTDDAGRAARLCLNGKALCGGAGQGNFKAPNGEAFYWSAESDLRAPGIDVSVEFALEAAFAVKGRPIVFDRLRIRGHVSEAGSYTVTTPYGDFTVRAADPAEQRNVNTTHDKGCGPAGPGLCTFRRATHGRITTFLRQVGAPKGFYGNPNFFRPVTNGASVSISGPAGSDSSDRFAVMGKKSRGQ